jgi:D-ribose pyranase
MLNTGILNPALRSLLARVRHTNTLVIADRGFPFWPGIETIDLALVDGIPTVLDVLAAITAEWHAGQAWMADEFRTANEPAQIEAVKAVLGATPLTFEPHSDLKLRVPKAIGLVRTGDTLQYANLVLESA